MTAHAVPRSTGARLWALSGTALIAVGVVVVLALHVVTLEEIDPVRRDDARRSGFARATWWLGAASLAWLLPILVGIALRSLTGVPWWQFVPLGLFERGLALTEVAALVGWGRGRPGVSSRPPAPSRRAGAGSPRR